MTTQLKPLFSTVWGLLLLLVMVIKYNNEDTDEDDDDDKEQNSWPKKNPEKMKI